MQPKKLLIEARMGGRSLSDLISHHRSNGASWQEIADYVRLRTGVVVSRESIRRWTYL
ncbi:hypothetical protein [Tsukamurella soli]|uniref:Homeodomain-like domain-containing protein n=1 Tax=Tsukamurella soli TaxID=644556 RepID=A0ABP8JIU6_9ACTN